MYLHGLCVTRDPHFPGDRSAYEHTDYSGTQDHIAREYNAQVDEFESESSVVSVSTCEVCGESIPPTRSRCNDHEISEYTSGSTGDEWSISRVAIAVVPGTTYYHAVFLGAAAFRHRNNKPNSTDSFDLIYDFDDEPSQTLVRQWGGDLPDAVRLDSEQGTELYETGIRKTPTLPDPSSVTDSKQKSVREESDYSDVYIYSEDGTPAQTKADIRTIEDLRSESDQPLWVVTALLYKRSTQQSTANHNDTRRMFCQHCAETQHIYRGSNTHGEWECTSCGSTTQGQPPGAYDRGLHPDKMARSHEEELFEQVMTKLYNDGKLPW